ncbi:Peptidoglycan glycosyltransferase [Rhodomicrobium vannielii ATCC 17100]|uniref:Peptidoglycan glycosyltransferase n=1 Tax=Rhodomicrobium vannielii (strain ATCC 17100 / DSM 162 / LMG 4299 / NCIMB 10020 / ATH 3.1.1) TaxID=648757 RepID=E3I246_RHOVT|nr:penicillin-binding protein 2 [Rhodomicrobium vannielii]ADP71347.1 Peptidoglycan glycosyltransferase [Rhodomicrobium vannielii ATCC 17100]
MVTLASLCRRIGGAQSAERAAQNARSAQRLLAACFAFGFLALSVEITRYGMTPVEMPSLSSQSAPVALAKSRPDIVDRNGRLLATDIRVYWLVANPSQILNPDEAAEKIVALFPDLDQGSLARRFRDKDSRFEYVKRGLTPKQAEAAHALGIPALTLLPTVQRVYPAGSVAAHILGITNVDNEGRSGVEWYIDQKLAGQFSPTSLSERPIVKLSLDLGVQHALTDELSRAMERYTAQAAMGIVLDVKNGEVVASASLPDFDPNRREQAAGQNRQNRVVTDVYELGSVFKSLTIAMALDQGIATRYEMFDATPFKLGRFTMRDPHASRRMYSVEDIFIHSSNTGSARIALAAGGEKQQAFLRSLGLFEKLETEAGSSPTPVFPKTWRSVNVATVAYGHGIAVPPLLFASAMATLVNGGERLKPTFLIAEKNANDEPQRVISPETSATMRDLMRAVVERGTGRKAAVQGLGVGGKTGTALKVKEGRYSSDVINSFVAAVPIDAPRYLVMVTIDEPHAEAGTKSNEASQNAAPTVGAIIKRIAPMLDILPTPRFDEAAATSYEQPAPYDARRAPYRNNRYETGGSDQGYSAYSQPRQPPAYGYRDDRGGSRSGGGYQYGGDPRDFWSYRR